MKKLGYLMMAVAVIASISFSIASNKIMSATEKRLKGCEAELRGIRISLNDCADGIEAIYAKLERREDDGK